MHVMFNHITAQDPRLYACMHDYHNLVTLMLRQMIKSAKSPIQLIPIRLSKFQCDSYVLSYATIDHRQL